jgi:hypothetical protein
MVLIVSHNVATIKKFIPVLFPFPMVTNILPDKTKILANASKYNCHAIHALCNLFSSGSVRPIDLLLRNMETASHNTRSVLFVLKHFVFTQYR